MAKKYYAVRKGSKTGIYNSWEDCKGVVDGYKGAEYAGFNTYEEAENYMQFGAREDIVEVPLIVDTDTLNLYLTSNIVEKQQRIALMVEGLDFKKSYWFRVNDSEYLSSGDVSAKLLAGIFGIDLVTTYFGCKTLNIITKYEGLENWATGRWSAKGVLQTIFYDKVQSSGIDINFYTVKSLSSTLVGQRCKRLLKLPSTTVRESKILQGQVSLEEIYSSRV